jgi:hypothetical protein
MNRDLVAPLRAIAFALFPFLIVRIGVVGTTGKDQDKDQYCRQ